MAVIFVFTVIVLIAAIFVVMLERDLAEQLRPRNQTAARQRVQATPTYRRR